MPCRFISKIQEADGSSVTTIHAFVLLILAAYLHSWSRDDPPSFSVKLIDRLNSMGQGEQETVMVADIINYLSLPPCVALNNVLWFKYNTRRG